MHVKWDERLHLGVDFMDEEHRAIIEKLEKLLQRIDFEAPSEEDTDVFIEFEDTIVNHFAHEELMMHQYAYPKLELHVQAHSKILEKINRYKELFLTSGLTEQVMERVEADVAYIFKMHLLEEDRDLEVFVHKLSHPEESMDK